MHPNTACFWWYCNAPGGVVSKYSKCLSHFMTKQCGMTIMVVRLESHPMHLESNPEPSYFDQSALTAAPPTLSSTITSNPFTQHAELKARPLQNCEAYLWGHHGLLRSLCSGGQEWADAVPHLKWQSWQNKSNSCPKQPATDLTNV